MPSRGIVLGIALLVVLSAAGVALVEGFASYTNIRSMLLLAAFLGLASIGQNSMRLARQHRHVHPVRHRFS